MNDTLTQDQKQKLRKDIVEYARTLLGVKYEFGAEWKDFGVLPSSIDCSEMIEGVFVKNGLKMPDGSQNQFNFCLPVLDPLPGDLAFFGRGGRPNEIYHVGLVVDEINIIEARAIDKDASFKTGEVILRPIEKWRKYKNFVGFGVQPKLA